MADFCPLNQESEGPLWSKSRWICDLLRFWRLSRPSLSLAGGLKSTQSRPYGRLVWDDYRPLIIWFGGTLFRADQFNDLTCLLDEFACVNKILKSA